MNNKVTKRFLIYSVFSLLFTVSAIAQLKTAVYDDATTSGMWFQGTNGEEVDNPVKDDVNSSDKVAKSATDGTWQQIQYFVSYAPKSGDKLIFSVYNPSAAGPGQIQFSYTGSTDWKWGDNMNYESSSETGWVEYSIELESHVGNEIDQIIMMPAGDNASAVYVDNIYFISEETTEPTESLLFVYNDSTASGMWFQGTNGEEVENPVKDDVNSSDKVAKSATDGTWQQIQYFVTYAPKSGDKLFFSVYNPSAAGPGQIQFSYTGSTDWKWGDNMNYESSSETGWVEYSIELESHVGNEIDQIIMMPAGDNANAVYVDNIYFNDVSILEMPILPVPTFVYNDSTASGMWFQGTNGEEVENPVKDEVNSSDKVAKSATDGTWQQIQYFVTYSPKSGDKLFFSVYNPSAAGPGQIQFSYTGSSDWKWGDNMNYESGSETGWVEYSIELESHVGNEIDQIIMMPAGDNANAVYVDNVYFSTQSELTVSIDESDYEPQLFSLEQNYPNPFNPTTTIRFTLEKTSTITLKVFNIIGQEVATLFNGATIANGTYAVVFNASKLTSGIYIYQLETESFSISKRMILIK